MSYADFMDKIQLYALFRKDSFTDLDTYIDEIIIFDNMHNIVVNNDLIHRMRITTRCIHNHIGKIYNMSNVDRILYTNIYDSSGSTKMKNIDILKHDTGQLKIYHSIDKILILLVNISNTIYGKTSLPQFINKKLILNVPATGGGINSYSRKFIKYLNKIKYFEK